jgi:hypothetical protein
MFYFLSAFSGYEDGLYRAENLASAKPFGEDGSIKMKAISSNKANFREIKNELN